MENNCKSRGCTNKRRALGYCPKHHWRFKKYGNSEYVSIHQTKHGYSKIPEYVAWVHFKQRCYNKQNNSYADYGGRGITVDDRWLYSFTNFLEDMGNRPSKNHSIDRIDNNKGYSKENCRWTDRRTQSLNQRKHPRGKSGYMGVRYSKPHKAWHAYISGKYIGTYKTPEEAAWMYDQWALYLHGDLCYLNFEYV